MVGEQAHAQMAEPQAPSATPELVIDESLMDWTIGGSMLYWGDYCPRDRTSLRPTPEATEDTYLLRRTPLNGGVHAHTGHDHGSGLQPLQIYGS